MSIYNAGVLGNYNISSNTSASGVYALNDVYNNIQRKIWPSDVRDPYYNQVSFLLKSTNTVNSNNNVFLDSSTNNFAITRNGNVAQGTFSPFSASRDGWSAYFDGSGDYWQFTNPSPLLTDWWTTQFTIECWINAANFSTWGTGSAPNQNSVLLGNMTPTTTTQYWSFGPRNDGRLKMYYFTTAGQNHMVHPTIMKAGEWYHIAMTVDSSQVVRLFVNGQMETFTILGGTPTSLATTPFTVGQFNNTSINGWVTGLRMLYGTCLYNRPFVPPTRPLERITNTSLLLFQNSLGNDDSSYNLTPSRVGNVTATIFCPYTYPGFSQYTYREDTTGSAYYDGTGDYLRIASSPQFTIGTSDFTIEQWVTIESYAGRLLFEMRTTGTQAVPAIYYDSSGFLYYYVNGANRISYTTALPQRHWIHIAVSRVSSQTRMFVNGVQVGSTYADTNNYIQNLVDIGGSGWQNSAFHIGYIGETRFIIGTGLYTTNFTPPTEPFTAITNTRLLVKNGNSKIYDVTGGNTIETIGDARTNTSIVRNSVTSIAFDGSGDRLLTRQYNTSIIGLEDFTIEFWTYMNTVAGSQMFYEGRPGTNGLYPLIYMNGAVLTYFVNSSAQISGFNLSAFTWYHIAVCRSNQVTKMFLNGVQYGALYTDTNSYVLPAYTVIGSDFNGSSVVNGVIEDLRVTKGTARYWSNFTPPGRLASR